MRDLGPAAGPTAPPASAGASTGSVPDPGLSGKVTCTASRFVCPAPTTVTGARNRYPRRASVSMNRGFSAESPSASLNLLIAVPRLWSKSTMVSWPHSRCWISSRVTTSPGRSSKHTSTRNGCACNRMRIPDFRSSPESASASNRPNRNRVAVFSWCSAGAGIGEFPRAEHSVVTRLTSPGQCSLALRSPVKSIGIFMNVMGLSGDQHLIEKRPAVHCWSCQQTRLVHTGSAVRPQLD